MPQTWQDNLNLTLENARKDARSNNTSLFFTLTNLLEISKAPSKSKLLDIIEDKIREGDLGVFYRVLSPETNTVIAEFSKAIDIPSTIYDDTAGHEFIVDPLSNIEIVFRVPAK